LLIILSLDNTGGTGGDTQLAQSGEYGGQTGAGPGGVDDQSDRYTTAGQYGGPDRATTGQTGQTYADPRIAGAGGK